jgi:hypothetical protein
LPARPDPDPALWIDADLNNPYEAELSSDEEPTFPCGLDRVESEEDVAPILQMPDALGLAEPQVNHQWGAPLRPPRPTSDSSSGEDDEVAAGPLQEVDSDAPQEPAMTQEEAYEQAEADYRFRILQVANTQKVSIAAVTGLLKVVEEFRDRLKPGLQRPSYLNMRAAYLKKLPQPVLTILLKDRATGEVLDPIKCASYPKKDYPPDRYIYNI